MASGDGPPTLADCPVMAFVPAADLGAAEVFYVQVLRLRLVERSEFALVLDCAGTTLRVARTQGAPRVPYTVAGWLVPDVLAAVDDLAARGVTFSRYDGMDQDDRGVWTSPSGARIAWFEDPDRNVLSLTETSQHG
jgi:catechol 2,3-dioxygenase-like lactoylglutathione lyase family enzyme